MYMFFAGEFPLFSPQDGGFNANQNFGSIFINETLYTLMDVSLN